MYTYLDGRTPFYKSPTRDYYAKYAVDGVIVTCADSRRNSVTDMYMLDGDRYLQPIDKSEIHPEHGDVTRLLNQILLFHSHVPFFGRQTYHFFAEKSQTGIKITVLDSLNGSVLAVFTPCSDGMWSVDRWSCRSESEEAAITGLVPKAKKAFQRDLNLC